MWTVSSVSTDDEYDVGPSFKTLLLRVFNPKDSKKLKLKFRYDAPTKNSYWFGVGKIGVFEWKCKNGYY